MLTMHPTLLIGPSDWQADVMPRTEFAQRLDALWRVAPQAERAIVYGNSRHHAELAYFTNFVPKLDAAVALLSRSAAPRLLVGGGPNMLAAARPLTFVEDVAPLRDLAAAIKSDAPMLLVGAGYMPTGLWRTVMQALGTDAAPDATGHAWTLMSRKSPHEIAALRRAHETLCAGTRAMADAFALGHGVSAVVAAGEAAVDAAGAQEVRTLFSLDGGRTLRPFFTLVEETRDPLHVYIAVRRFNYWVEDFAAMSRRAGGDPVRARAIAARDAALAAIEPGTAAAEIERLIADNVGPYALHPLTARAFAQRMGLALDEPPYTDLGAAFEDREVYTLRVGTTDGERHHIVSSMLRVRDGGVDLIN